MAYTVDQIKVAAYNFKEPEDLSPDEHGLFLGLAYCYEWYRASPQDKEECEKLAAGYIYSFEYKKWCDENRKRGD